MNNSVKAVKYFILFLTFSLIFLIGSIEAEESMPENLQHMIDGEAVAGEMMPSKMDDGIEEAVEDDLDPDLADAKATIKATGSGGNLSGEAIFYQADDGVIVKVLLENMPAQGMHGIHIHENGSCADNGAGAGGHFNPHGTEHGFYPEAGMEAAHLGDMGNIDIHDGGKGWMIIKMPNLSLKDGPHPILGKSVILHEKADDFGQPTGNAGGRIGCGIIVEQL